MVVITWTKVAVVRDFKAIRKVRAWNDWKVTTGSSAKSLPLCWSAWDANDRCSTTETFPGSNYFISNLAALTNFQSSAEQHQTLIDFVVFAGKRRMVWEGGGGGGVVPWRARVHLVQVIPVVFSPTFLNSFFPPGAPRPPPAPPALPRGRPAPPLNTATTQDTE